MSPTLQREAKIRIHRGLKSALPTPPNSFEIGRPYFCTDTHELFVGEGLNSPMAQVQALDLNFLGNWDSAFDYQSSDLIVFNNLLWVSLTTNTNSQPDINPTDWSQINAVAGPIGPKGDKGDKGDTGAAGAASTVPGPQGSTQLISATSFPTTNATLTPVAVNFSASGDNIVVPGIGGKKIQVWKALLVSSSTTTLTFKDGAAPQSGPLAGKLSIILDLSDKPWYSASTGNDLVINQPTGVQVGGTLWIVQE